MEQNLPQANYGGLSALTGVALDHILFVLNILRI